MKLTPRFFVYLILALAAPRAGWAATGGDRLEAFFRDYLEESFRLRPVGATQLGDHRFDQLMDDLTSDGQEAWERHLRHTLEVLPKVVEYGTLDRASQIDYEIFRHDLETEIWLLENMRPFEQDPRVYNNYLNESVYLVLAQSTLPPEQNVSNAIARMGQMGRVLEAARANLKNPPRVVTVTAIRQNQGAIAFYEKAIFELAGRTRQSAALRQAASSVVESLKGYATFLESDLLPRAVGEWRLGRDRFVRNLELVLDAGLSADEVQAEAKAEFDWVQNEMYVIARQLWSRYQPGQPLPTDDATGRRETVRLVLTAIGKDHGRPEDLTRDVRRIVARIKPFIEKAGILTLPMPDRCRVIEMPEFQRGNSTAYMNSPPPLDPDAAGYFAVSPPPKDWDSGRVESFLEEYNRHMLEILTIHEAYPGHYVQYEYANRNASLIRRVLPSGAYVEGWAVSMEQTMLDQGYGDGDLALRLTQLKFYLRAVANTILDYRMHCEGMTDEAALDLLMGQSYQSEGEARLKVIRSKQSSAQLSTYFIGRLAHSRLRTQMQRELGPRFNLAKFHEAVLEEGAVPMKFLQELVRARLIGGR